MFDVDWRDTALAGMEKHTIVGGNWFIILLLAAST